MRARLEGALVDTWLQQEATNFLVFKRAHALGQLFGQPHRHRALIEL